MSNKLFDLLEKLENSGIYYRLNRIRESILIEAVVPGTRWEIEVFPDGEIVIEKFFSEGKIHDEIELKALFDDSTL